MYSNKLSGVGIGVCAPTGSSVTPSSYALALLTGALLCSHIAPTHTQQYQQSRHFGTGQRFVPGPVYSDPMDYSDTNQYQDYAAPPSQNDQLNSWSIAHQPQLNVNAAISMLNYTPVWVPDWPNPSVKLGQVSAVSIDTAGRVFVFHRATRTWDRSTFTQDNRYWNSQEPPILAPTIAVFNATSGDLIEQWGENLFYLPHGLTIDGQNNIWVTDVALHQVMKFPPGEKKIPSLTLGVRFTPGNDYYHFCKPSGVAVMESGEFFVSDGYCNTRIIKYSPEGKRLLQWGRNSFHGEAQVIPQRYSFAVPHALALAEDIGLICVADRENGRVQCFNMCNGSFVSQYHSPVIGARLFSVAYSSVKGGQLYVVNGPEYPHVRPIRGFVIDINSSKIQSQFGPDNKDFSNPHDIAVSKDGKEIYVVELDPFKVHKFTDPTVPDANLVVNTISTAAPNLQNVVNSSASRTTTIIPVKPTATVEGLAINSSSWGGWAGVAGGVAGGLAAVLLLLLGGAILLARARHHRGCLSPLTPRNRRQRWDYAPGAPDFKFRHLLERQRAGFERVNTDESDEEPTPATSMLAPQNA